MPRLGGRKVVRGTVAHLWCWLGAVDIPQWNSTVLAASKKHGVFVQRGSNTGDLPRVSSVWIQNHLLSKVPNLDAEVFATTNRLCARAWDTADTTSSCSYLQNLLSMSVSFSSSSHNSAAESHWELEAIRIPVSPTQVRSATPASVWTPAEQKSSLRTAQWSLKGQREPAQQRPLKLETVSRNAPIPHRLQLMLHIGGCIRGMVPLPAARGTSWGRGFLPNLHGSNSNLAPNWTSARDSAPPAPTWSLLRKTS